MSTNTPINSPIYSNVHSTQKGGYQLPERKETLIAWLYQNVSNRHLKNIEIIKFLFFFECFSKIDGDEYDFSYLQAYENGPCYADVLEVLKDNNKNKKPYSKRARLMEELSDMHTEKVNQERAQLSWFLVDILGNNLSDFTHMLNFWQAKEDRVNAGEKHIPMDEKDFDESDIQHLTLAKMAYTPEYINSVQIKKINGKVFLIPNEYELTADELDSLELISNDPEFTSPVLVTRIEEGLLVD